MHTQPTAHIADNVAARMRGETKIEDRVVDRVVANAEKYGMTIEQYVLSLHRHVTDPDELRFWMGGWMLMIRENLEARSTRH
jgi:hypothetical protein